MKLDNNSNVYINCRTKVEQDMVIDILEDLGKRWGSGKYIRQNTPYKPPMVFRVREYILHGGRVYEQNEVEEPVIEAKDLYNQWISLKRRK